LIALNSVIACEPALMVYELASIARKGVENNIPNLRGLGL